jgi:hypothetical protein
MVLILGGGHHYFDLNGSFHRFQWPLPAPPNVACGSKAPIRFLNQRPFDQLFTWLGSPIFEHPLCRFLHWDCDDEQRLLWPSLWSFPT